MKKIVSLTGHRPRRFLNKSNINWTLDISKKILLKIFSKYPDLEVNTGMALGFDTWVADICLQMDIPFNCYLAFDGQDRFWSSSDRRHYSFLLSKAKTIKIIDNNNNNNKESYFKRDRELVNNCDAVVSAFDQRPFGGTYYTTMYAMISNRPIFKIDFIKKECGWI